MRLTITPLGATGATSGGVAAAVVNYLEGARGDPGPALLNGAGAGAYYADSREGPGRWIGAGAAFQNLAGGVRRDAFERVLDGRHPHSGARLLTARGSSQRAHLAVGSAARFDASGEALYTVADAAALLGMRQADVDELVAVGLAGDGGSESSEWLASQRVEGVTMIPDAEITRHLDRAATGVDAAAVLAGGDRDDELSVAEAARQLQVTSRYVRRLCDAYLAGDEASGERRARLACRRDGDGPYRIRRGDLAAFAQARKPPVARVGFDCTLTCEKSIGIAMLLSDGDRQAMLVHALRAANDTAIGHLDDVASLARKQGRPVRTEGLVVASYFHTTSRALDPHPHHHNVVANAVVDADGDVRALDARALYRHAPAAAALGAAALRWELREAGVDWWRRDDGMWELAGVDERAIREFSRRRSEMDEVRAALEAQLGRTLSHREEDTVALSTRAAKHGVDVERLVEDWRRRAGMVGLDLDACFEQAGPTVHERLPDRLVPQLHRDLIDPVAGLCSGSTTFRRGDVLAAIADWSIDVDGTERKVVVPPAEVERLADDFLATNRVVELAGASGGVIRRHDGQIVADGQHDARFSTVELLEAEHAVIARFQTGRGACLGCVDDALVDAAIAASTVGLSDEQVNLVRSWCTSGWAVQAAVGRAGAGKTTAMRAAGDAWRAGGYRVIGAAVKGQAARQLATDAGIDADTVALLLARCDAGQHVLDASTVLIIDEASTIGTRDLRDLLTHAGESGAVIRLIGDPAQHGSVPAGGIFADLATLGGTATPELAVVHRLHDAGERRRAELVRSGIIVQALNELVTSGQLVLTDSDADTYAAVVARWYDHRRQGADHPMVHGRNRQRRMLNQLAQHLLTGDGIVDIDQAVELRDGRRIAVGDDIVARHGDRSIHPPGLPEQWMRNGTTGRVVAVHHGDNPDADRIVIDTGGGRIECRRSVFDRRRGGLDLGYAVTSYAVQGSTHDASTSALTTSTSRNELYVDITRGRTTNQLYATRTANDLDREDHLPAIEQATIDALRRRLSHSGTRTATSHDPNALAVARIRSGRSIAGVTAAGRRGHTAAIERARRAGISALRRQARHNPPESFTALMPHRPTSPHLAARWDDVAGDVAVHHTLSDPRRSSTPSSANAVDGALGPRPDDPDAAERWGRLAVQLVDLAVDVACWQLDGRAGAPRRRDEHTMRAVLEQLAIRGELANVDADERRAHVERPQPDNVPTIADDDQRGRRGQRRTGGGRSIA